MEQFINGLVAAVSSVLRFDTKNDPKGARKKSLIVLLVLFVGLQVLAYISIIS